MKIHYLVTSLETGGAEFAIPNIVKALEHFGHHIDVTACEPRDMGAAPHLDRAGVPYRLLDKKRRNFFLTLFRLIQLLRQNRPDVIWTSLSRATLLGQLAGKLLNIPVVSWKNSASIRFTTTAGRRITKLWIADSPSVAQFLHEKMNIPHARITTWPLYAAEPPENFPTYWNGTSPLHIGSTGRLHEVKNYPLLIEAIALFCQRHPEWANLIQLSLAGDGPQRAELEALIKTHHLEGKIHLRGFLEDVPSFLATLHLYAQPSRYEGMCLAAHEAMNAGLPIIATPVGEMRNSVQEKATGFIVTTPLAESICATLEKIFQDPAILQTYGQNAHNYIQQHYGKEAFLKRCAEVLERIKENTAQ